MSAWEIKGTWTAAIIYQYRTFIASEASKRSGVLRSTCEDLALRLTIEFAESRHLPIQFTNGANPDGLSPNNFRDTASFTSKVLTSTGASDLLTYNTVKLVKGASESNHASLGHAKKGDLIILYDGGGHVQVVTSANSHQVSISQGNFRPSAERCSAANRWWNDENQNSPSSSCYIGAIVADRTYDRNTTTKKWDYNGESSGQTFSNHGRLTIWDFDKWNLLVSEHTVKPGESLSAISAKIKGDGNRWNEVYQTNKSAIGSNPDKLRVGTKLYVWK